MESELVGQDSLHHVLLLHVPNYQVPVQYARCINH
jgi:hypothetical protein